LERERCGWVIGNMKMDGRQVDTRETGVSDACVIEGLEAYNEYKLKSEESLDRVVYVQEGTPRWLTG